MVELDENGGVERQTILLSELMKSLTWFEENGTKRKTLPLRDLRLFLPNRIRKLPPSSSNANINPPSFFCNHSRSKEVGLPAIMPRPKAKCYLLDLGALKFLCRFDRVHILYANDSRSSRRTMADQFVEELRTSLIQADSEKMAFELQVLEAALAVLVSKNFRQLAILAPLLDELINDTIAYPTEITVGRLAALKKSIFNYNQGIQAIIGAIRELLSSNRDMADMYLGERRSEDDHEEVEFLLEAYLADFQQIEMESTGMVNNIDDTMELIGLHLNSRRNSIIKLSLIMETCAVATGSCAVVGSIFGMNLLSGMENHPNAFYWVAGSSLVGGLSIVTLVYLKVFRHFFSTTPSVEHQHSAMKHFFSYIEDIEAKVRLSDSINRHEFENIVTSVIGNVDPKEIDLFFKVLDGDKNSKIDLSELPRPKIAPPNLQRNSTASNKREADTISSQA